MCDVTVDNFEDALKRLRKLIPQSDFVSIDLEFTGLDHDAFGAADCGAAPQAASSASNGAGTAAVGAGCAAAGSADKSPAAAAVVSPATQFDVRNMAQAKYEKMSDATDFLVVQVRF